MVDYLCDMGAFSKSIFAHVYIGFNMSDPPGRGRPTFSQHVEEVHVHRIFNFNCAFLFTKTGMLAIEGQAYWPVPTPFKNGSAS